MSFTLIGAAPLTEYTKLTGSSVTEVLSVPQAVIVESIECTETAGGTPTITLEVYDPNSTTSYYLANQRAMTARGTFTYDTTRTVPNGWKVRATSSDAQGDIDVLVNYFPGDASRRSA